MQSNQLLVGRSVYFYPRRVGDEILEVLCLHTCSLFHCMPCYFETFLIFYCVPLLQDPVNIVVLLNLPTKINFFDSFVFLHFFEKFMLTIEFGFQSTCLSSLRVESVSS